MLWVTLPVLRAGNMVCLQRMLVWGLVWCLAQTVYGCTETAMQAVRAAKVSSGTRASRQAHTSAPDVHFKNQGTVDASAVQPGHQQPTDELPPQTGGYEYSTGTMVQMATVGIRGSGTARAHCGMDISTWANPRLPQPPSCVAGLAFQGAAMGSCAEGAGARRPAPAAMPALPLLEGLLPTWGCVTPDSGSCGVRGGLLVAVWGSGLVCLCRVRQCGRWCLRVGAVWG